ncbi:acyltransferase family protein [Ancylobacter sp.]|uniref:acyltransferase family protein n=1 Tax=Ancylobacter sp. TaxID=1872567 RepID=UPI003BA90A6B
MASSTAASSGTPVSATTRERFTFFDGIRGLGAIQVVLAHMFSLFFPVVARVQPAAEDSLGHFLAHSPFFFVLDGGVAVFAFFLMSGFVLSHTFLKTDLSAGRQVAKRFVRLYLPVLAALALAIVLLTIWPGMRARMEVLNASQWIRQLYVFSVEPGWPLLQDVLLNSMLLGYSGASIFGQLQSSFLGIKLVGLSQALDPPLWTLHIEFWGSLLTLAVVKAYTHLPRIAFWPLLVIVCVLVADALLSLFIIGFLAYIWRGLLLGERGTRPRSYLSGLFLVSGIVLSVYNILQPSLGLQIEKQIAALLIVMAVLVSPRLRRLFSLRWAAWLGRLSFSIYLTHFPILFTIGIALFLPLEPWLGYMPAALIACGASIGVSLLVAIPFERYIDRPSIRLSHRVGGPHAHDRNPRPAGDLT